MKIKKVPEADERWRAADLSQVKRLYRHSHILKSQNLSGNLVISLSIMVLWQNPLQKKMIQGIANTVYSSGALP